MTKFIDAAMLSNMIISGAHNLSNNREFVDSLNVFPVPDGDTGTNMSLTFINAARNVEVEASSEVSEVAALVDKATLRGARGNSGVILSQLFRGFTKEIKEVKEITADVVAKSFERAVETAYKAVMK
ncbi:MAG: DAK2 domain-containing protein, partial [Clostridia bacterium]|nr:DAK2 domain-containing protein [Clostridia bacterium]